VKRSGRNEPISAVIYMCMEAMLGISLYSYLYFKLAKTTGLSYYLFAFSSTKLEKRQNRFCLEVREEEGRGSPNYVHTYE
jgi:hypothetical protein